MTENEALFRIKDLEYECMNSTIHYFTDEDIPMLQIAQKALEKKTMLNEIMHELSEYQSIGTIEEFKTLKEKEERFDRNIKMFNEIGLEIRAKTIDELKNKVCMHFADWKYSEDDKCIKDLIELASESVEEIAEQMKAGGIE